MADTERLDTIISQQDYNDYRWFDPKSIVVAHWVRMKCEYGCDHYGRNASCPPNTPSVEDCRRFFGEYSTGVVIHFQKVAPERDKRRAWTAKTNVALSKLERDVFLAGYPKTFLLFMDSCHICADCAAQRTGCKEPKLSRPSPEAMAMDVFSTVRRLGFPIEVLTDTSNLMNRYAFLLVE